MATVEELDALAEKATARPWSASALYLALRMFEKTGPDVDEISGDAECHNWVRGRDVDFIIALVNAYPSLSAELKAARAVCEKAIKFLSDNGMMCGCDEGHHDDDDLDCDWYLGAVELSDKLTAWRQIREGT